jgi:hypothetical protein
MKWVLLWAMSESRRGPWHELRFDPRCGPRVDHGVVLVWSTELVVMWAMMLYLVWAQNSPVMGPGVGHSVDLVWTLL